MEEQHVKIRYAIGMQFDNSVSTRANDRFKHLQTFFDLENYLYFTLLGARLPEGHEFRFDEIVFVHSAAEAEMTEFSENVIVAWPSPLAEGMIEGIHWGIRVAPGADSALRRFGLSYPVTIADLVDNWEKVNEAWQSLSSSQRNTIQVMARRMYDNPD